MSVLERPPEERDELAQELLDRLTPMMSALGIIFVLVILGEQLTQPGSVLSTGLSVLGWVLWAVFAAEFAARAVVAADTGRSVAVFGTLAGSVGAYFLRSDEAAGAR